jgi:hypothetical protein
VRRIGARIAAASMAVWGKEDHGQHDQRRHVERLEIATVPDRPV